MKKYLIVLLSLLGCNGQQRNENQCNSKFLEVITSDLDGNSSFLVFDVKIDGKAEKICIPNRDLYWRLKKKFDVDGNAYTNLVRQIINHEKILVLAREEIGHNYSVKSDNGVKKVYEQGIDSLKNVYFQKNGAKRHEVIIDNPNYIASLLFENCIISWIDDETGYMIIKEKY